jgi:hypothetical protein
MNAAATPTSTGLAAPLPSMCSPLRCAQAAPTEIIARIRVIRNAGCPNVAASIAMSNGPRHAIMAANSEITIRDRLIQRALGSAGAAVAIQGFAGKSFKAASIFEARVQDTRKGQI